MEINSKTGDIKWAFKSSCSHTHFVDICELCVGISGTHAMF